MLTETPFGDLMIEPSAVVNQDGYLSGWRCVRVTTINETNVDGQPYGVFFSMMLRPSGWEVDFWSGCKIHVYSQEGTRLASRAEQNKVMSVLVPHILEWISKHPDELVRAEYQAYKKQLGTVKDQIDCFQQKIIALTAAQAIIESAMKKFDIPQVERSSSVYQNYLPT